MSERSRKQQIVGLLGWLGLVFAAAAIGAAGSIRAGAFYSSLALPSWAPPSAVFGPVWSLLYGLMGLAAWLVWREGGVRVHRPAFVLFVAQLAVNALWSWLFFGWHRGGLAFADIVVLWTLVLLTTITFWRINRLAGGLLLPYLLWVSFAAALNLSAWQRNLQILGS